MWLVQNGKPIWIKAGATFLIIFGITYLLSKWRFSCSLSGHTGHIGAPVKLTIEPIMAFMFGARSQISFNYMSLQYLFLEPHLTIYQWREVTKIGTSTLWPRAVTMKLWGPLKLIQRVSWNIEIESCVVMGLQVYCQDIQDILDWMLFCDHSIHVGSSTQ